MNAKIMIAGCMLVAAMNHASAAIVDADTELRAFASSVAIPGDPDFTDIDERTATFSGYGSFSVSAEAVLNNPGLGELLAANVDVRASVQPHAISAGTVLYNMTGSTRGVREGTGTAIINFNLSELGVWTARPGYGAVQAYGIQQAEVSLLRNGQEVYHQDCSGFGGQIFCVPYYSGGEMANPDYVGTSLELQQGDYTLLLTASEGTFANNRAGGNFSFDLQLVPVPAALPLFLSALAAFGLVGWRRR